MNRLVLSYKGDSSVPTKYISFQMTPTWAALGDSYTEGTVVTSWANLLATRTSTNVKNLGVSSTTANFVGNGTKNIDGLDRIISALYVGTDSTSSTYSDISSIIMYGFNDIRNNLDLYNTTNSCFFYMQMLVGIYLTMTVPQSKTLNVRSWTRSGTWTNTPVYDNLSGQPANGFGLYTGQQNAYLESPVTINARYYGFRFTGVSDTSVSIQITIDGVVQTVLNRVTPTSQGFPYSVFGVVVDMGSTAARTVRITNLTNPLIGGNMYVDFVAHWNEYDSLTRSLLVCIPPTFNYGFTGPSPWNAPTDAKRLMIVQAIKDAVNTLSKRSLPVFIHETSVADGLMNNDSIHWTSRMAEMHADDVLKYSIQNYQ